MKNVLLYLMVIVSFTFMNMSHAFDSKSNYTLTLTVINNSDETLSFSSVKNTKPGNTFTVIPAEIPPRGAATVVGTTTEYCDLAGQLVFKDSKGNGNILKIHDAHYIDYRKPVFSMENKNFQSFVTSETLNRNVTPRVLMYTAATVSINNVI